MTPEVGKFYKTRNGYKAFAGFIIPDSALMFSLMGYVILNDGSCSAHAWMANGRVSNGVDYANDLVEEWKEPRSDAYYQNIYDNGTKSLHHKTRNDADVAASFASIKRIACVRVEWKEGQFDD